MSPKITLLKAVLTALGLLGLARPSVADPGAPDPTGRTASPAPSSSSTVLLLNDGRVLEGKLSENESGCLLHIKGNVLPVRKHLVLGAFGSIQEAYRFQADRLPERDPDEQMKLARWCLTNHLTVEAKTHLQAVLALSPKHGPARAMLASIEAAEERAALRDPGVLRTMAEVADDRPGELNLGELRPKKLRGLGSPGLPRIFDLPTPLAVRRANEFARSVHPVLQTYCARCHHEQYPGEFQLIEVKTRHDRTPDALRANLDATLRLVDPENPAKSELLSSSLRPHGSGKVKRPVFIGSNDPAYQVLSNWVNSLRSPDSNLKDGVMQPGYTVQVASEGEGFAVDRGGQAGGAVTANASQPMLPNRPMVPRVPSRPPDQIPPTRYVPDRGMVIEQNPPQDDEFPVPYMLGGPKPKINHARGEGGAADPRPTQPPQPSALDSDLPVLPEVPRPRAATGPAPKPDDPAQKKARTPVKIDPALLERALINRNTPR
jgi:hypothetical protein